ncbi:putative inorganic pyrophosphatase [Trypanosoma cruzi]|uniref:inorganic diphosphatase n=2 Tax=Trypanosoma cruzi TaxID=5693 RepID=Q4DR95_TRYCC|nr:inorganic pyrophosphatase, putative [Trypanosoma cruzi]EAN95057.1 inorganic pyrophosphatase, putative [Trypanosoma cruzi]PWV18415.1 putative inorganic pyrophosphatase [Trypanosoma cruzi]RNC61697.1 inorganic pyrophosphatase [Trypanosoma cruzi]|eukprot:XP_816908.1 inorganic pyrophosphatase [Trypanosoma cruzi strain CL Brener]
MRGTRIVRCAAGLSLALPRWRRQEVGAPSTHAWRMFFTSDSVPVTEARTEAAMPATGMRSAWHDLSLHPAADRSIVTFVCEIPKGTRAKVELQKEEPHNPFAQDVHKKKEGKPLRFYTYGDIPFNYGFAPQTWEDPLLVDADTKCTGDGDPIDIVEVSNSPLPMGSIWAVRVLGVLGLIDEGETDWKIIAETLRPEGKMYESLEKIPQELRDTIVQWMRDYKTTDGKKRNELAFNGELRGAEEALHVIRACSRQYATLIDGNAQNPGYWLR